MLDPALQPLVGTASLVALMGAVWFVQRRTENAGWVDLAWAAGVGALALLYAVVGEGWGARRALVALLAGAWSLRLSLHLARRLAAEQEDGRYTNLRERWGQHFTPRLFWFDQAQGLLAVLLSLAFWVPANAELVGWRWNDAAAIALWIAALVGESVADRQLAVFRALPENAGRTCRRGLWAWSRHPNYFFEWLHWLVYPLLAIGLEHGAFTWLVPALMLFLVLRVTGIPPTEEQSLKSRGEDYRAYRRSTNAFFPGPPRPSTTSATELQR